MKKTKIPEEVKKVANPFVYDPVTAMQLMLNQGKPINLLLEIDEQIREQRRSKLVSELQKYGVVNDEYPPSTVIGLNPYNLESGKKLVDDHKIGKLEGIIAIEVDSMALVLDKYASDTEY